MDPVRCAHDGAYGPDVREARVEWPGHVALAGEPLMLVRVQEATAAADLQAALRGAGCTAAVRNGVELSISHPLANDEHEAATEIAFFVRAWQSSRAVEGLELVADA